MRHSSKAISENGHAQQCISSNVIANNGDVYTKNDSSNSSIDITVGEGENIKRRRDHFLLIKPPLFSLLTTGPATKSFKK